MRECAPGQGSLTGAGATPSDHTEHRREAIKSTPGNRTAQGPAYASKRKITCMHVETSYETCWNTSTAAMPGRANSSP